MLSRDEQAERIIAAWVEHGVDADTTATEMAEVALTALECGEPHPDRRDIRCTQLPHGNGHLYHRNTGLGIEWWASGDRTNTIHDVLGPISLVQHPVRADVEVRVPFIGGTPAEPRQEQQRGRYHTLPPCEVDTESVPGPECICSNLPGEDKSHTTGHHRLCLVHSMILRDKLSRRGDALEPGLEPSDTASAVRCGAKHPKRDWRCDRDPHDVTPDDHETWHHDRTRDRYWAHAQDSTDADRAVYRDLIPVLDKAAAALGKVERVYKGRVTKAATSARVDCEAAANALANLAGANDGR